VPALNGANAAAFLCELCDLIEAPELALLDL
jgi:pyruvate/2-oxoglutarate dehydrogenase complex dihydrolipoamide acyltransferase (E2) component